jgi:hypothetical protein
MMVLSFLVKTKEYETTTRTSVDAVLEFVLHYEITTRTVDALLE